MGPGGRRRRDDRRRPAQIDPGGGPGHGVEQLGVLGRDGHDVVDTGPERPLQDLGRQFVDDHDGPAAGTETDQPGDLRDDLIRFVGGSEDHHTGPCGIGLVGEGRQVFVADDIAADLLHAFGEDEADDLVRVDHADGNLVTFRWLGFGRVLGHGVYSPIRVHW